jgi:hypothetical protein
MNTQDFFKKITSKQLKENLRKQFGTTVTLEKYSREQLEDMRNKLRTRVFQQENSTGINDLLTNETYQKDKAMLDLLNTRIKEMLGEDIKKLRDKMDQLSEAKKGVRAPKYTKKSKGSKGTDQTGDGVSDFDDVQVARMTAGGVPKKKAIAKATSDNFKEEAGQVDELSWNTMRNARDKSEFRVRHAGDDTEKAKKYNAMADKFQAGMEKHPTHQVGDKVAKGLMKREEAEQTQEGWDDMMKSVKDQAAEKGTGKFDKKKTSTGTQYTRKASTFTDGGDDADTKKAKAKAKKESVVAEKDEGKPGKNFAKIAKSAGKHYGSKEAGERVAGSVRAKLAKQGKLEESNFNFKQNVRFVNESLAYLINEDEEGKAKAITAASDIVNDYTSWMQRVGQYQTKAIIELADAIKADFGAAEAEAFKAAVAPALSSTLETLTQQREAISGAVAALAGEAPLEEPMGMEPGMDAGMDAGTEPGMDMSAPDEMNPELGGDEFGASDAGASGREMRESAFERKLQESHSIISKLAR